MKFKPFFAAAAMMLSIAAVAQPQSSMPKPDEKESEGFKFDTIKVLPITSIKDQNQAGTCWCYSSLAFFESELLRMGKPEYTSRRCTLFTKPISTVLKPLSVPTAMFLSHKVAHLAMSSTPFGIMVLSPMS